MNALPDARRAIHGRTHSRTWHAADFDPIERWPRARHWLGTLLTLALLAVVGVLLAWRG